MADQFITCFSKFSPESIRNEYYTDLLTHLDEDIQKTKQQYVSYDNINPRGHCGAVTGNDVKGRNHSCNRHTGRCGDGNESPRDFSKKEIGCVAGSKESENLRTLFMALLRACGIPCRVHGFTIDKKLQKGAMTGLVYRKAPSNVFHSWVEVYIREQWFELEAFILDRVYLQKLQAKFPSCTGSFCGYGVAVDDFKNPVIDFNGNHTYIQSKGINQDFGVYDSPDEMLRQHHQVMSPVKAFAYRHLGRHLMNRNVRRIREAL